MLTLQSQAGKHRVDGLLPFLVLLNRAIPGTNTLSLKTPLNGTSNKKFPRVRGSLDVVKATGVGLEH